MTHTPQEGCPACTGLFEGYVKTCALHRAAPDLLAALRGLVRCIEAEGCDHVAVEDAAAAIAKAEGA